MATTRGYMHHRNGSEQHDQVWYAGRTHFEPAFCDFERALADGEIVSVHVGHGIWREYVVEAADGRTALLRQV